MKENKGKKSNRKSASSLVETVVLTEENDEENTDAGNQVDSFLEAEETWPVPKHVILAYQRTFDDADYNDIIESEDQKITTDYFKIDLTTSDVLGQLINIGKNPLVVEAAVMTDLGMQMVQVKNLAICDFKICPQHN